MSLKSLPPSPNWYMSAISDANERGLYVYGAMQKVYVFDISVPSSGLRMLGYYPGHEDRVTSVALCPNDEVSVFSNNQLTKTTLEASSEEKYAFGLSKESLAGSLCCSAGDDMVVKIWEVNSFTDVQSHKEHKGKITTVSWCALNTNLIASGDERGEILLWNRKSNTIARWRQEKTYIYCTAFCPHVPALLAVGVRQGTVFLVDFSSGTGYLVHRLRGHEDEVMSLSWCPIPGEAMLKSVNEESSNEAEKEITRTDSGCLIATGSKDRTIRVWSCSKGQQVLLKKLPVQRREQDQGTRTKTWVAVCWLKHNPELLVSSSSNGDLLLWNLLHGKGHSHSTFYAGEFKSHARPAFNICSGGAGGNTLCTFSQDRTLMLWDAISSNAVCSLHTLGGFVYCLRSSPLDPGRVAVGVGDNVIRVWNMSNKMNAYDITSFWQGIKNKVTAVSWHPVKEGILAYGTDDGRVAVLDIFSRKMPVTSGTLHVRTVYVVAWGPSSGSAGTAESETFSLYSVGDCKILEHTTASLSRTDTKTEAINFSDLLIKNNIEEVTCLKATEISWNLNLKAFAVGADDGVVYVFDTSTLKLLAVIKIHLKLINCVRWHPKATSTSPNGSPCQSWLASGGNDQVLHVVDLSCVFAQKNLDRQIVMLNSSLRHFTGHTSRITDICWSPHHDGRLISVGYDAEAYVWDVQKGVALCQFKGHHGRLLTCQFSGLDPDLVITAGTDSNVMVWRVSEQPIPNFGEQKKKKKKLTSSTTSLSAHQPAEISGEQSMSSRSNETENGLNSVLQDLHDLLMTKELMLKQKDEKDVVAESSLKVSLDEIVVNEPIDENSLKDASKDKESTCFMNQRSSSTSSTVCASDNVVGVPLSELDLEEEEVDDREADDLLQSREEGKDEMKTVSTAGGRRATSGIISAAVKGTHAGDLGSKKKWRPKAYFPATAKADNRNRAIIYEDLYLLTKLHSQGVNSEEESVGERSSLQADKFHLGLFTDRRGAYLCLQQEEEHHLNHENMEYALQMEVWKGNITGAIQMARERGQLSDWIVSLAPLASYETWLALCEEYAEQLEEEGLYHKAVSYLLACHKLYPAIDLFRRHKLFREAVALARVRLSPLDPVLEDLYTDWSEQLMRDGAYEQAAKCYLAMKQIQDAAKVIARRCDQNSLQAACHLTLLANEKQQGQLYAQQVVTRYLANHQWKQALAFLKEHQPLKVFIPYVSVHEMMVRELSALVPEMITPLEPESFLIWDSIPAEKASIPEFILDPSDADPVLPWETHLVDGHAFPHHILRVWYIHLNIAMATEQLHVMYHALQQLHSGRQIHLDTQQVLLQVCSDVMLWLLALLTNQTSLAISHLLGALSTLHDGGHHRLLTAVCRLLLPQGPKYMLKLQHEVTALRVLISMEAHTEVEGGGRHLSLRRYLSELKEEPSVSTGNVRCRQLDCVRAYYYIAILHHLQDIYAKKIDDAHHIDLAKVSDAAARRVTSDSLDSENRKEISVNSGHLHIKESSAGEMPKDNSVSSGDNVNGDRVVNDGGGDVEAQMCCSKIIVGAHKNGISEKHAAQKSGNGADIQEVFVKEETSSGDGRGHNPVAKEQPVVGDADRQRKSPTLISFENIGSGWCLTLAKLLQLSKGLLWDIQAKRLALTETLGYIHRAISQHLLTDQSQEAARTLSRSSHAGNSHNHVHTVVLHSHQAHSSPNTETVAAHLPDDPFLNINDNGGVSSGKDVCASASVTQASSCNSSSRSPLKPNTTDISLSKVSDTQPPVPNLIKFSESDFNIDLATLGQQLDGSRRVLWEDDPVTVCVHGHEGLRKVGDGSSQKPTCLLSPAKYINVPDEWYSLPVDEKYSASYVTLAVLKDEQDFVMGELKRMSDSQVLFPSPFMSMEFLLDVCVASSTMTTVDKEEYLKSLHSWALHFAVTSQQRGHVEQLFVEAEKSIGL